MPVFKVRTFRQHLDASVDLWIVRVGAILFSTFGTWVLAYRNHVSAAAEIHATPNSMSILCRSI